MSNEPTTTTNESPTKKVLTVELEEGQHEKLREVAASYGLKKATYARMVMLQAIRDPERFAGAFASQGG